MFFMSLLKKFIFKFLFSCFLNWILIVFISYEIDWSAKEGGACVIPLVTYLSAIRTAGDTKYKISLFLFVFPF